MSAILFALHDPPYGSERVYNGLRWALQLAHNGDEVRVFLFGDAVLSSSTGQKVPDGFYNTGKQTSALVRAGGLVGVCGTCMDARGLDADRLLDGAHRSSMVELAEWTTWADKVINV
ncbi:MAG TPA: DsrE family protein [Cellulomonas sp.]|uniref:DsrE/DsrF/TusD sulfur relay family protein n=1 Tax=Cellulomonas sp. TaxID=40001 RepID=UPI002E359171|nr:DsrE family protein [Cellulomonas sp.]HEX5332278.1 DsrE family protein [Cellulomonas sp.]